MAKTIQVDDDVHNRLANLKRTLALKAGEDVDFNDTIRYLLDQGKVHK